MIQVPENAGLWPAAMPAWHTTSRTTSTNRRVVTIPWNIGKSSSFNCVVSGICLSLDISPRAPELLDAVSGASVRLQESFDGRDDLRPHLRLRVDEDEVGGLRVHVD